MDYRYILSNLILGNVFATAVDVIEHEGIESVLSIGVNGDIPADLKERMIVELDDNVQEAERLLQLLPECIEFIARELECGRKVLVHCNAGISRSASVVIAYLMRKYTVDYDSALEFVRERKPNIDPNAGFAEVLEKYWT